MGIYRRGEGLQEIQPGLVKKCVCCKATDDLEMIVKDDNYLNVCKNPTPCLDRAGVQRRDHR